MPIDPNIILGVQPVKLQDPLESYGKALSLKALMGQQTLQDLQTKQAQQGFEDDQASREAYQQAGGDPSRVRALLAQKGQYKQVQALDKLLFEQRKGESEITKNNAQAGTANSTQLVNATKLHRDDLANVNDPESAARWVQAGYQNPILGPVLTRGGTLEEALARVPKDPTQLMQWVHQNALGATKFIELDKPNIQKVDDGSTITEKAYPGLGGAPTVLGTTAKTATPGELLSDATRKSEGEATRSLSRRNADMADARARDAQNSPQYMETDAGLVALPKRLPNGQQPVGTPVMGADGQPLGKPLKPLPPAVNDAVIGNAQSLYSLDKAINLAKGTAVDSASGDANATGYKAYLPQNILNRIDPSGIDTRAEIADIGSLKIHDRSGAAVTISESPRLMPFIPQATDNQATVIKKLTRLKEEAQRMQGALTDTYSKEQGYKPNPVSTRGGITTPAPAAAPKLGAVQDGFIFKGGDPANPKNWEKAGR